MAGRLRMWRPKFPLYHTFSNLSSKISHKFTQIFYPEFVHYSILQSGGRCSILSLSRGERYKPSSVCPSPRGDWSKRVNDLSCAGSKKNVKNPLTNPLKYDTIRVSRGGNTSGVGKPTQVSNCWQKLCTTQPSGTQLS